MAIFLPILIAMGITQAAVAIGCLIKFPSSRLPAILLLAVAPLASIAALYGDSLLTRLHTASSYDPVGDGFDILFQELLLVFGAALLAAAVSIWLAMAIASPRVKPTP
jgi:hypothetical protein